MKREGGFLCGVGFLLGALLVALSVLALGGQAADSINAIITAIDVNTRMVTAKEPATGRAFQFQVRDAALLNSLKAGQKVSADFNAMTVTLPAARPGAPPVRVRILKAEPVGRPAEPPGVQSSSPAGTIAQAATSSSGKKVVTGGGLGALDPNAVKPSASEGDTAVAARGRPGVGRPPQQKLLPGLLGEHSGDEENGDNDPDPEPEWQRRNLSTGAAAATSSRATAGGTRLKGYPKAQEMLDGIVRGLTQMEIDAALLGGQKYMINNCLGVKASAGKFKLKLAHPNLRWEGTGAVLTFRIERISFSALKIRMRPRANPIDPCKFSGRFEVGGAATDVHYEMRLDPLLDLQQCRLGSMGQIQEKWRIGGLNLKPLQNNLDNVAKNMIEDSLTYASNFNIGDRIVAGINGFLGAQCHK
ncbi:MAG: hypothetical protein HXY20_14710 [Acidobacteria bacterium]|nr:hypothetical protein [Acidobacteriota bacterium]